VARGSTSVSFTPKAFDLVHAVSGGVPRMINLLCDRALMVACEAQTSRITEEQVVLSAAQIGLDVPKGKVKGERSAAAVRSSKRSWVLAAILLIAAIAGAVYYAVGNPIELLSAAPMPTTRRPPARPLPARIAALAVPAGPLEIGPPPQVAGSFSVLVGTFDTARQVDRLEAELRAQRLPVYLLDVVIAPGDVQRRVLVGRYPTQEEADAVRQKLGPAMNQARVIPGEIERLRIVP
jgi:cell division septation protein DedD